MNDERERRKGTGSRMLLTLLVLLGAVLVYNALFSFSYSFDANYRNVSIDTTVNITGAAPEILLVTCPSSVTLSAGGTQAVSCNVSVRDYNGAGDINFTNGTFFHSTSTANSPDNNNTHYTNTSCSVANANGNYANYTCTWYVYYYALNGTWTANITVQDNSTFNDTSTNTTTINALLALNISTTQIDYGDLAIYDTSANKTANITNFGNVPINVSVTGYGSTWADGLAMTCDTGNITIDNERFSTNITHDWNTKTPLNESYQMIQNLTVPKNNDSITEWNVTYWQLYVPPNPFGVCNGTVVFQAESAS